MRLVDRDLLILKEIGRWQIILGRHIKKLVNFTGSRACDRRLKLLLDNNYIERKKILYGVPYIYSLTHKGRILLGLNKREDKIRVDRITHDIYVLDTVIYFTSKYQLPLKDIESEKELHIKDGFGVRKHQPDYVMKINGKRYAVEVELNPKAKIKLEKNLRDNYMTYDGQFWFTNDNRVFELITNLTKEYANIRPLRLEEVINYVKR